MADPSTTERRRLRRIVQRIPASFRAPGLSGRGYIRNISKEGLFLRVESLPAPGVHVEVVIERGDGPKIEVAGTVRWTTAQLPKDAEAQPGFGLVLDACTSDYQDLLESVLLH